MMKILLSNRLLLLFLLVPGCLFSEDALLIINSSGNPDDVPRFTGSFEHLSIDPSRAPEPLDYPVQNLSSSSFRPRVSLTHRDRSHAFLIEEGDEIFELEGHLVYGSESSRCLIYLEAGSKLERSGTEWERVGAFFDRRVSRVLDRRYGRPSDIDGNGKVVILYYGFADSAMLGYFSSGDLESRREMPGSNEMEILYMNCDYGRPASAEMMETLPHEYMHLLSCSIRKRRGYGELAPWLDEGLAECATDLVLKRPLNSSLETLCDMGDAWTRSGIFSWGEGDEDYALSYLFLQYLRIQAGTRDIFRDMIRHRDGTAFSLPQIMRPYVPEFDSLSAILKGFYLALILDEDEGIYGFKDLNPVFRMEPLLMEGDSFDGYLYPGGAVYLPLPEGDLRITDPPSKQIMILDSREF